MAKNTNKTTENDGSVTNYINAIVDDTKRKDFTAIIEQAEKLTKLKPKMWGTGIVGFGSYHYKYESGREGDAPRLAFAARASSISLYVSLKPEEREELLSKFGKYKSDKGCINIKKLADVDTTILGEMIKLTIENAKEKYPV